MVRTNQRTSRLISRQTNYGSVFRLQHTKRISWRSIRGPLPPTSLPSTSNSTATTCRRASGSRRCCMSLQARPSPFAHTQKNFLYYVAFIPHCYRCGRKNKFRKKKENTASELDISCCCPPTQNVSSSDIWPASCHTGRMLTHADVC